MSKLVNSLRVGSTNLFMWNDHIGPFWPFLEKNYLACPDKIKWDMTKWIDEVYNDIFQDHKGFNNIFGRIPQFTIKPCKPINHYIR